MTEKIDVVVANPAGNTTILVLTPVPISRYGEISDRLLAIDFKKEYGEAFARRDARGKAIFTEPIYGEEIRGEQVGFVLPDQEDPSAGRMIPAMNMSGLEFCGNATRAFGFYAATAGGEATASAAAPKSLLVKVSGCDEPVMVEADPARSDAAAVMPLPRFAGRFPVKQLMLEEDAADGILADMDGIFHLVLRDVEPRPETFEKIKGYFYSPDRKEGETGHFPAFGVMFIDTREEKMTPVVYVHDVDTTYFEGSCASGTTAAAFVEAMDLPDGTHRLTFREPAGTLYTEVTKKDGKTASVRLNGLMELSDVITVEI